MEQLLLEFGLKDGIFVGLFIWLLIHQMKTSQSREDKLYGFLDSMKTEFAKLVGSYEALSKDVSEIREELHNKMDKNK
jgi:BhlA holin family